MPYKFAKNTFGSLFCYLGCELRGKASKLNLLKHLAHDHYKDKKDLEALGLNWSILFKQC